MFHCTGSGISAGDIATDISNTTTQTFISARHGFNISPVIDSHGWPFDVHIDCAAERDVYLHVFPVHLEHPTLACLGFFKVYSIGSPICVIDMQARWVARIFKGESMLPSKEVMLEDIRKRRQTEYAQYGKDVFRVYAVPYMDHLATLTGCYPSLVPLFFTDPRLSIHMLFGPVVPASYRLVGPHRWEGAREAILNSLNTTFEGTRSKTAKYVGRSTCMYFTIGMLVLTIAILSIFLP
ncbi:Dimethylaniline monooxygenase [N-oxide-forming] 3 [Holothuria leucospilota]|uniref:Flavin-containing monooxygenase n=1 Tax=Holothuria leucospilota TaxID=206669 RepID=A0A9Q0YDP7_HOLLE|nr:Dimethylaniline monooxygenase [N-oxide-forming] 3 [Holothuria leucospilota]